MRITKHAYKRAKQRLGLNRKAFKRMIDSGKTPDYVELVVVGGAVVTVKNLMKVDRSTRVKMSKMGRLKTVLGLHT